MQLMEDLVAQSAQRHGYILTWEARPLAVRGVSLPVGADIATEMRMLQAMLGGERSPLAVLVYRNSGVVRVVDAGAGRSWLQVTDELFSGRVHRSARQTPMPASETQAPLVIAAGSATAPAQPVARIAPAAPSSDASAAPDSAAAASYVPLEAVPPTTETPTALAPLANPATPLANSAKPLRLPPGLAQAAFARVAAHHAHELNWDVDERDNVYAFDFPVTVSGRDIAEDLTTLAKALSLNGAAHFRVDIYSGNRIVRVTAKE
jgi:hypothetical protein